MTWGRQPVCQGRRASRRFCRDRDGVQLADVNRGDWRRDPLLVRLCPLPSPPSFPILPSSFHLFLLWKLSDSFSSFFHHPSQFYLHNFIQFFFHIFLIAFSPSSLISFLFSASFSVPASHHQTFFVPPYFVMKESIYLFPLWELSDPLPWFSSSLPHNWYPQ